MPKADEASASAPADLFGGIDIGGTKILAVVATADGKILGRGRRKTKAHLGFETVVERSAGALQKACQEAGVEPRSLTAVGVGAPSPITQDGIAIAAPNMGWKNAPLVPLLHKTLGVPVYAENDCNVGALGEVAFGAGKGAGSLIGLFVGTGLGGGIVLGGELVRGTNRMAAEVGHMTVVVDGRICGCGHNGCLEAYVSKTGMGTRFIGEIIHRGRPSRLAKEAGDGLCNVRSSVLKSCYEAGDEVVVETLRESARYLGIGVGSLITLLGPDMIVIGGGVYEALGKELLPLVKQAAQAAVHPPVSYKDTKIVLSALMDDAVALGAVAYALRCR